MKIIYYDKDQSFSESRLLESLVNLGYSPEEALRKFAALPLFYDTEYSPDYFSRPGSIGAAEETSPQGLVSFERLREHLQQDGTGGRFESQTGKVLRLLVEARDLAAERAGGAGVLSGIPAGALMDVLLFIHGLDALGIGSVFIPALPLVSSPAAQARLVEAVYQISQVKVAPPAGGKIEITWLAAAVLAALADFQSLPFRFLHATGGMDLPGSSGGVLNVVLGELEIAEDKETVLIQTNMDDMSPQLLSYAIARLFEAGALDVYQVPIHMKKNRMGTQLNVTARRRDEARIANLILSETTTLGVNVRPLDHRYHAEIRMTAVETKYGSIPLKQKFVNGVLIQSKPEYEAAAKIAAERKIALDEVYNEVVRQLESK